MMTLPSFSPTDPMATRVVVTWEGPGEPIMLTIYGPDGKVAVPLLPAKALKLAQELLTQGVQAIKADSWDAMYAPIGQAPPCAKSRRADSPRSPSKARQHRIAAVQASGDCLKKS